MGMEDYGHVTEAAARLVAAQRAAEEWKKQQKEQQEKQRKEREESLNLLKSDLEKTMPIPLGHNPTKWEFDNKFDYQKRYISESECQSKLFFSKRRFIKEMQENNRQLAEMLNRREQEDEQYATAYGTEWTRNNPYPDTYEGYQEWLERRYREDREFIGFPFEPTQGESGIDEEAVAQLQTKVRELHQAKGELVSEHICREEAIKRWREKTEKNCNYRFPDVKKAEDLWSRSKLEYKQIKESGGSLLELLNKEPDYRRYMDRANSDKEFIKYNLMQKPCDIRPAYDMSKHPVMQYYLYVDGFREKICAQKIYNHSNSCFIELKRAAELEVRDDNDYIIPINDGKPVQPGFYRVWVDPVNSQAGICETVTVTVKSGETIQIQ